MENVSAPVVDALPQCDKNSSLLIQAVGENILAFLTSTFF